MSDANQLFARTLLHGSGLRATREFRIDEKSFDAEKRTAVVSFSSEFPVLRTDFSGRQFYEVLDHESVDMSRMSDGAPLLYGHRDHIGTVDAAAIGTDKRGRAIIRFSRSALASEKMRDVEDKILTKTSVGYDLGGAEYTTSGERDGVPVYRFRNWAPYEVTLTPLPADNSVGVGRSDSAATPAVTTQSTSRTMPDISAPAVTPPAPISNVNDHAAERQRVKDINAAAKQLATRHPQHAESFRELAARCAETGDTVAAYNQTVLNDILGTQRTLSPVTQGDSLIGMSQRDVKRYSILRAIQSQMEGRPVEGLEREMSDEVAKKLKREARGFFLPDEIVERDRDAKRTLSAGSSADGGYTIGSQILTSEFVTLLRNNTKVMQLGARFISGLQGDVSIPRQLTGATVYWVSETGSITSSSATFGQIIAKPRRVGTSIPYTKQFLAQTSLSAESFVVNDSDEATAVDLDRVAIRGAGGSEPLGILNLASGDRSTSVTFSGAATWAKYLEFFTNVATNNALLGTPGYLTTPASAAKAMGIAKFTNGEQPIWTGDGKIGMFKAEWSTNFATTGTVNQVIFGDFSQVIFLEWAGRDVVVDPYSGKKEGTVEITIQRLLDMVIRRGKSFAISSDTGAA